MLDQLVDQVTYLVVGADPVLIIFPGLIGKNQPHSVSSRASPVPASSCAIDARKRDAFFGVDKRCSVSLTATGTIENFLLSGRDKLSPKI